MDNSENKSIENCIIKPLCMYNPTFEVVVVTKWDHVYKAFIQSLNISSVQSLSHVRLFATSSTAVHQASLSITNSRGLPKLISIELLMPSSHLILCHPLLLLPPVLPSIRVFSNEWGGQSTGVSALASFLPKKSQGRSPSEWTGWIPYSPGDSQDSSPTPQFKSINSSALSLLHSPTLTSIPDRRKNHSLD